MTEERKSKFTVINNDMLEEEKKKIPLTQGYQTNPFYERLAKFNELQSRKRFTVEDLLR